MSDETPHVDALQAAARDLSEREERLQQLAEKFDTMLGRWTRLEEHHARALADLQHSASRVQLLEKRLQQYIEKAPHDNFVRPGEPGEMPAGMKALVNAVERVETRLAAREEEVRRWLTETRSELESAAHLLKENTTAARHVTDGAQVESEPEPHSPGPMFRPDMSPHTDRSRGPRGVLDRDALAANHVGEADRLDQADRAAVAKGAWGPIGVALAGLVVGGIAIAYSLQLRGRTIAADARARSAEQQVLAVEEQSTRRLESVRAAGEREVTSARESAAKANAIADVLAAPDLIRFDLAGTALAPRARGQGLWSRSRGLVFTASRLPVLPEGSVYHLWLITNAGPVSIGSMMPDSMGRITFIADRVPTITGRVVGLILTSETPGEHQVPGGATYLTRAP